mmetsp:Transcript_11192/g.21065  ORF Transcript_11192/g.21065 Transcript_11192/m.21065 type:complete len:163 (+) Transcript_11192:70-558(+)
MHLLRAKPSAGGARPRSAMRPAADPDDMEDLLRHVRRGVEARTQTQMEQEGVGGVKSSSKTPMARCQSEATVAQEEPPVTLPRAAVRGRYVFSGGSQILAPGQRLGAPSEASEVLVSPRPMDFASRRPRGRVGGDEAGPTTSTFDARQAAEAMAAECDELEV